MDRVSELMGLTSSLQLVVTVDIDYLHEAGIETKDGGFLIKVNGSCRVDLLLL